MDTSYVFLERGAKKCAEGCLEPISKRQLSQNTVLAEIQCNSGLELPAKQIN